MLHLSKKHIFLFFVFQFTISFSISQKSKIDSLFAVVKTTKQDSIKVNVLNDLSFIFYEINPDSAAMFARQARALAHKTNYKKGEANACIAAGVSYYVKGDYTKALDNYFAALRINEALKDKIGIAGCYGNIGVVYWNQTNYAKALDYYFKELKIAQELGNKSMQSSSFGNIGIVYWNQKDFPKALDNYFKSLKIDEEIGNENGVAYNLSNIGGVFYDQADYPTALNYFFKSAQLNENLGNKNAQAAVMGNIGGLYFKTGKFKEAEKYLQQSLDLSENLGSLIYISEFEQTLSSLYDTMGRHQLALEHFKKYVAARDSITNEENTKKQVQQEMQYTFDKQQTADSIKTAERTKQEKLKHEQEIKQQKIFTYGGIGGFGLMLIVAIVSIRAFRNKQKANLIIAHQKELVEEKQKEILDSIHYAKRIQMALLPAKKYIDKQLRKLNGPEQ